MNILLASLLFFINSPAFAQKVVTLDSKSPLVQVKIMVKGGSAADPAGKEGTAFLLGQLLVDGGFGDPENPVTKEKLAELTRAWGSRAFPSVSVSKEVLVLTAEVPRGDFARYAETVLGPMLTRPLFAAKELERLRGETLQSLTSGLRLERVEELGLVGMDALMHNKEPYGRPDVGTENGLKAVTRDDAAAYHKEWFKTGNMIIGLSTTDSTVEAALRKALAPLEGAAPNTGWAPGAKGGPRSLLIVSIPNAASAGVHAGHPIAVTRTHADFWPLYVGNIWFGTHRDGFSHLYVVLREERGYNYGDYSYIEHFEGRPYNLFPPFNTPRRAQYFSIWVRPVAHAYVPHVLKAITWELEELLRAGLTDKQCEEAKNKAKVLYLSLAETSERLLASRLDDAFYGMEPGYLPSYLKSVDAVTCEQVNAALRKHLNPRGLQYLVTTSADSAAKLADDVASGAPAWGKEPADYQIDVKEEDGKKLYLVPEPKLDVLRRDAIWANHPLAIGGQNIRVVPVETLFAAPGLPQ